MAAVRRTRWRALSHASFSHDGAGHEGHAHQRDDQGDPDHELRNVGGQESAGGVEERWQQRLRRAPLHDDQQPDQQESERDCEVRDDGLAREDASLGERHAENDERRSQNQRPEVVHLRRGIGAVRQNKEKRYQDEALGHVQPEYPPPAQQFDDGPAVEGPQNGARLGRGGHESERYAPVPRRHGAHCHRKAYRDGGPAPQRLQHPGRHYPFKVRRQGHQRRADGEHDQRSLEHLDAPVDVRKPARQRHRHGVGDEVRGYDPRRPVEVGQGNLQLHHDAGQGGDHDGLVQRGREHPKAENPQDYRLGGTEGSETGPGGVHDPDAAPGSWMSTGWLTSFKTTRRVVSGPSSL